VAVSFGIEEEFLLLDRHTAMPEPAAERIAAAMKNDGGSPLPSEPQKELLACQLESSTPVCTSVAEALGELSRFRHKLARTVHREGLRAAGVGAAPRMPECPARVAHTRRYHDITANARGIVADQYVNGLHIHVGVPDREAGVRAMNQLRPWLPTIVAIGANSPFWHDRDSGFASWRTIHYRRWSIQGSPPEFADAADYDRRLQRLLGTGVVLDTGHIGWTARLSENYPTLEVRAPDSQLEARDSVLLAAVVRALVIHSLDDDLAPSPAVEPEFLDIALWQAARHGLAGELLNTADGSRIPAREQIQRLLDHLDPVLRRLGDADFVRAGFERLFRDGTGAERQRRALKAGGMNSVLDLFTSSLVREGS
jgi:glutamate---cysteine ligase / carboxylate-amine ligase